MNASRAALRLARRLEAAVRPRRYHPRIYNVNNVPGSTHEKRALIVYLPRAFALAQNDPRFRAHQNLERCKHMASVLGELGYVVDVVGKRDPTFRPSRGYDLVVSERLDWKRSNNHGFPETIFAADGKDFDTARRHFLFLASRSQMQKGLDLLLEIFPRHPDLHLYVCSQFEKEADFCALYRRELFETPNVHALGWLQVNSPAFDELVQKCGYVVAPTSTKATWWSAEHMPSSSRAEACIRGCTRSSSRAA